MGFHKQLKVACEVFGGQGKQVHFAGQKVYGLYHILN